MALQDRIRAAHAFDASRFVPFVADGATLGFVRRDLVCHLRQFPRVFRIAQDSIGFHPAVQGYQVRSRTMAGVARELAAQGRLTPWRDETYDVVDSRGGAVSFVLERSAVRFFGFTSRAVHVNGLVENDGVASMWIARRSADKAIDPGMLDNMVGGGLASGLSPEQTLIKEAWEEAGIPTALAQQAHAAASLRICREVPQGLHAEHIRAYDLLLPSDFVPSNQDAEVAQFRLLGLQEVVRELDGDAPYTVDAGLVAIDCLARHASGKHGSVAGLPCAEAARVRAALKLNSPD